MLLQAPTARAGLSTEERRHTRDPLCWQAPTARAGLSTQELYTASRRPHVAGSDRPRRSFYQSELDVLGVPLAAGSDRPRRSFDCCRPRAPAAVSTLPVAGSDRPRRSFYSRPRQLAPARAAHFTHLHHGTRIRGGALQAPTARAGLSTALQAARQLPLRRVAYVAGSDRPRRSFYRVGADDDRGSR